LAGMAALLLTFGLVLTGCPTDGGDPQWSYTVTFNSNGGSDVGDKRS
jgi:hypothetical protein